MNGNRSNRSVRAEHISDSNVVTGDSNVVSSNEGKSMLLSSETINVMSELSTLKNLASNLRIPEQEKLDAALEGAEEELIKSNPDKARVASSIETAVSYMKSAESFSESSSKIIPHVLTLSSWLGNHGRALLDLLTK